MIRTPPSHPVIMIPARMASARLPGKALADIGGLPMIVQVWRRAMASGVAPVVVACDGDAIKQAVEAAGGRAIITDPTHPSGSDRVAEALQKIDPTGAYDAVINVQGDLPTLDPAAIRAVYDVLADPAIDIATLAVPIKTAAEREAPQIVKAVLDMEQGGARGRALYFSRLPVPSGAGSLYHHVGIYAYRRDALARFVAAKPTPLEKRESLEQLRALSLNMRIEAAVIDTVPLGVDTPADLEQARALMGEKK